MNPRPFACLARGLALAGLLCFLATPQFADAQNVPTKTTTQVFRLGGPDAPEAYAFAHPPQLIVSPTGVIFARIGSDGTVLVFHPDGRFDRRIGRTGQGPGEFQVADEHGFIGDTLWVRNWPAPRISLFLADGRHLATTATPYDIGKRTAGPTGISGFLAGGRAYVRPSEFVIDANDRVRMPMLLGARDMKRVDTVATVLMPQSLFIPGVGMWGFGPVPRAPLIAVSSTGTSIAVAEWNRSSPTTVDLRVLAADGTERLRKGLPFAANPIPTRIRDSLIALGVTKARPQIDAGRRRGIAIPGSYEVLVERGLDLPPTYPPVRKLVLGIDGTIWLERFGEGRGGSWLVLNASGEPVFQVQLSPGFDLQQATARSVWGTERDDLDVAYLVRLDLTDR
jgi:hypothetical protein